ncbi:hypothetical protein LZK98_04835 [Sphingomonas cannabina]|uniref:hypothetical protein n=1 Tax=Sphingomonas cannabina TaxID=2899123 RepID=UPI001F3C9813|nr:hypothetical protein [Sphingomonas cannabina]UIJ46276.1 hypothetical protein LZK98_04835 [Sphingomonas cannabina]
MGPIEQLRDAIAASKVMLDPQIGDGFVFGTARLPVAGAHVNVNVDPESEDGSGIDAGELVGAIERVLEMSPQVWRRIIDDIAEEIEGAVGGEEVIEATDLRDDLAVRSVVVFADATLLSFAAPMQFPDSCIRVQLGEDFEVEDVSIDPEGEG